MAQENTIQNQLSSNCFNIDTTGLQAFDEFVSKMEPLISNQLKDIKRPEGKTIRFPSLTVKTDNIYFEISAFNFHKIFEKIENLEKMWISLYALYHFIFNTNLFIRIENTVDGRKEVFLMNDFSYHNFKEQNKANYVGEYGISEEIVKEMKLYQMDTHKVRGFLRRWKEIKGEKYLVGGKVINIEPIRFYNNDDRSIERIKKNFLQKVLNVDYVIADTEKSTLSLRTGEIFEYFTSTSLNPKKPDIQKTREFLRDNGVDDTKLTNEELEAQIEFVGSFLSHILK